MGRDELLGCIEIVHSVQFGREEICGVFHIEGVSLGDEAFEGSLVEYVVELFVCHHDFQFFVECRGVCCRHALDADRLALGISYGTSLAYLPHHAVCVGNDFHLFFA